MLFFGDVSIFSRPPFKTRRSHLNDRVFILSLAVFWLHFGTLKCPKGVLAFLVPRLGPKKLKFNLGNPPKVLRKAHTHNFGLRYASKSIKGSIDADFDLVFNKTLSQKNGSMGWGPGTAKGNQNFQNFQNMPSLWRHLQKTRTENEKRFSSMSTRRLAESVETCWIRCPPLQYAVQQHQGFGTSCI